MSFSLGGSYSSSKSKSKSDNSIDPQALAMFGVPHQGALDALGQASLTPYAGDMSVDQDPLQIQAAQMAQANAGVGQGEIADASGVARGVSTFAPNAVNAGQVGGMDLSGYMNPYQDMVLDSGLARRDVFRRRAMVGNSQEAGAGAWGGSRHGVADSLTNEHFGGLASDFISNTLNSGYDRATGLAVGDIDRTLGADTFNVNSALAGQGLNLQAAGDLAGFGGMAHDLGAADANQIYGFGTQAQGVDAANNEAAYNEFVRQQEYPLLLAGGYNQTASTIPIPIDNKSKGKQSGFGVQASGSFTYSDRRLKSNIAFVGRVGGINVYDYDIFGRRERGVMFDEVAQTHPHAVTTDAEGWGMVDYGAL